MLTREGEWGNEGPDQNTYSVRIRDDERNVITSLKNFTITKLIGNKVVFQGWLPLNKQWSKGMG